MIDIPGIIDDYAVDEVIIALPESAHQELIGIISLCEREKVGIRVLPDTFAMMASEVTIGTWAACRCSPSATWRSRAGS